MQKDWRAVEIEKLFRRFAAHARAHSSSGQNGSDSGHRIWDESLRKRCGPLSQGIEFTLSQAGVEICAGLKSTQKERGYAMT